MDIPWKSLSKSYVFGLFNTEHLCRNAQSCIRTSSPALRQWRGELSPCLFGNPALMVWPPHRCCVWPCQRRQKYSCTVQSVMVYNKSPHCNSIVGNNLTYSIRPTRRINIYFKFYKLTCAIHDPHSHWTRKPLQSLIPKKCQKLNLSTMLPRRKHNTTNNMLTWYIMLGMIFTIITYCHIVNHPNTKYQTITACPPWQLFNQFPPKDSVKVYDFLPMPFIKSMPSADTGQHSYSWIPM